MPLNLEDFLENPINYAQRISRAEGEELLNVLSSKYYNTGYPLVDDATYDKVQDILSKRFGNIIIKVGAQPGRNVRVDLPYPMFSLDKAKPDNNRLDIFASKYHGPYVISDKLDGISALLVIGKSLETSKMFTRGTSYIGTDISRLLPHINIDKNISASPGTAVRGELVISKRNFEKLQKSTTYKSARNTVAGLVNAKELSVEHLKYVDFVVYNVIHPKKLTQSEQLEFIKEHHFNVVHWDDYTKPLTEEGMIEMFHLRKSFSAYDADGLVITDNSEYYPLLKDRNPEHAIAFKTTYEENSKKAVIAKISWEVNRFKLVPRVFLKDPVEINNATISVITAHNARFVKINGLGPGAVIEVSRSGDVIPKITGVYKKVKPSFPPEGEYQWDENEVDILATESTKNMQQQTIKELLHSMQILSIKFFKEQTIRKILENHPTMSTFEKFVKMSPEKLRDLLVSEVGATMGMKLFKNFTEALHNCSPSQFMIATNLFPEGVGESRMDVVLENFPNMLKKKQIPTTAELSQIPSIGDITAKLIHKGLVAFGKKFDSDELRKSLPNVFSVSTKKSTVAKPNKILHFVFTGFRSSDLEDLIKSSGHVIQSGVSSTTDYLVVKDHEDKTTKSAKYQAAVSKNIPIILADKVAGLL